jgi:hypothetical protein
VQYWIGYDDNGCFFSGELAFRPNLLSDSSAAPCPSAVSHYRAVHRARDK